MRRIRSNWPLLFTFICCLALYGAYAMNMDIAESIAAILIAALSTLATFIFARSAHARFRFRWRDIFQAWRIPGYLIIDTLTVLRALARQLFTRRKIPSLLAGVPFPAAAGHSPSRAARRALAITCATSTPNFIALGFDPRRRLLIYHQILPAKISTLLKNLGAAP